MVLFFNPVPHSLSQVLQFDKTQSTEKEGKIDFTYQIDSSFMNLVLSYKTTAYWTHLEPDRACNQFHIQEMTAMRQCQ